MRTWIAGLAATLVLVGCASAPPAEPGTGIFGRTIPVGSRAIVAPGLTFDRLAVTARDLNLLVLPGGNDESFKAEHLFVADSAVEVRMTFHARSDGVAVTAEWASVSDMPQGQRGGVEAFGGDARPWRRMEWGGRGAYQERAFKAVENFLKMAGARSLAYQGEVSS